MAASPSLRMIETTEIPPPAGSVPETSIPLTFFDVLWLDSSPVERLFFYPFHHSTAQFTSSSLPALKSSLSAALQSFFPLAGNIRPVPGTVDKHEIHYTEGDSVSFTVVESGDHDKFLGDHPRDMSKLKTLVPHLRKNEVSGVQPVLAIQVTVFPCHGVVIGTAVHHSACDGNGSVNFMRTWAAICLTRDSMMTNAPTPVMFDRSIIPDGDGSIYASILDTLWVIKGFTPPEPDNNEVLYLSSFTLKQEHVNLLKEKLMREAENRKVAVRCSTVVVTYAFVWIGYVKAKSAVSETGNANCVFAVDHRQWFQPPIPENYFGNCIGLCFIQASAKDILGPNGFFEACQAISKAFDEVKKEGISDAKDWLKKLLEKGGYKPLSAAGSPRFRVYDVDFGWGKPVKVDIPSIAHTGAMAVAQSREELGGVEIELSFTQSEMEAFKNYFHDSLRYISTLRI